MMASPSLLENAFAHHAWATLRLIDRCAGLNPDQLQHEVPGTRGPIVGTLAHIVDNDSWDLAVLEGGALSGVDEVGPDLEKIRRAMQRNAARWETLVSGAPDPDATVTEVDPSDGFRRIASVGMRLIGSLEHGTDHRSQICTALTTLGVEPPKIDIMVFGVEAGRVEETPGAS